MPESNYLPTMNYFYPQQPRVSIGIPCYNSSDTIQRTLDSIQMQNYRNIEIVISDNCSTDSTKSIIESNKHLFPEVKLLWHNKNRGAYINYRRTIEASSGDYFIFLAADDYLGDASTIDRLASCLNSQQHCIAAMPAIQFVNGLTISPSSSTRSITGCHIDRVMNYLRRLPNDNPQFYSLYRRKSLLLALQKTRVCHAYDWIIILKALAQGEIIFCPETALFREVTLVQSYASSVGRDNRGWMTLGQPLLPFMLQAIFSIRPRYIRSILPELCRINRVKREEYKRLTTNKS